MNRELEMLLPLSEKRFLTFLFAKLNILSLQIKHSRQVNHKLCNLQTKKQKNRENKSAIDG